MVAGAPSTGDVLVVLANSWDLDTSQLAQDIVRSWAPDPLTAGALAEAESVFRFVTGTYTCELGQQSPFDLPPCEVTDGQLTATFEVPFELTGTFEGSGTSSGVWLQNLEDDTFTYTSRSVFMGEVEGCGSGTLYWTVEDGAGHFGETGLNYTSGNMDILPGGTLSLAGSIDMAGIQADHPDGTGTVPITGSYTCDDLAS